MKKVVLDFGFDNPSLSLKSASMEWDGDVLDELIVFSKCVAKGYIFAKSSSLGDEWKECVCKCAVSDSGSDFEKRFEFKVRSGLGVDIDYENQTTNELTR